MCGMAAKSRSNLPLSGINPAIKTHSVYPKPELSLPKFWRLLTARLAVPAPVFFSLASHFGHLLIQWPFSWQCRHSLSGLGPSLPLPFDLPLLSKGFFTASMAVSLILSRWQWFTSACSVMATVSEVSFVVSKLNSWILMRSYNSVRRSERTRACATWISERSLLAAKILCQRSSMLATWSVLWNSPLPTFFILSLFVFVWLIIKVQQHESDFILFYSCLFLFGLSLISYLFLSLILLSCYLWLISYWRISGSYPIGG